MRATRKILGHKVALLVSLLWLPYSVIQCVGCPGAESPFLRCWKAAGTESVERSPTGAEHQDCHGLPGEGEDSQRSCSECCGAVANRSALKEKVTSDTVIPIIAVLPALARAPVSLNLHIRDWPSISLVPPPRQLFLLFRSLLL
jgi:hypothetical protein